MVGGAWWVVVLLLQEGYSWFVVSGWEGGWKGLNGPSDSLGSIVLAQEDPGVVSPLPLVGANSVTRHSF